MSGQFSGAGGVKLRPGFSMGQSVLRAPEPISELKAFSFRGFGSVSSRKPMMKNGGLELPKPNLFGGLGMNESGDNSGDEGMGLGGGLESDADDDVLDRNPAILQSNSCAAAESA